jgi:4-hydroxythreonine-4-phosphate dehydrogenase
VREAQDKWILCAGPFSADGFFGSGRFKEFDAILAMYHDQGLIPFKTLSMDAGVNFTAGLPIVRTSPDHGTAYNIAGKNQASAESFRQAIYMGMDILKNRRFYDEARKNPLKKMFFDRGKDDEKLDLTKEE